jgi:hypothetical protein
VKRLGMSVVVFAGIAGSGLSDGTAGVLAAVAVLCQLASAIAYAVRYWLRHPRREPVVA